MRHGIAIFLGAFLLFALQPFAGRAILPYFGGGAGVWITCMLFFQIALLGGYAYAHGLSKRAAREGRTIHRGLLAAATLSTFLPLLFGKAPYLLFPGALLRPQGFPALPVLGCLAVGVGLPLVLLSTTSPLVQAWYHRGTGASPYRFYAVSNAGSLGGLLLYPLVMEPTLGLRAQAWCFAILFLAYVGLILSLVPREDALAAEASRPMEPVRLREWARWGWPAAMGTVLLLAVSNRLSSEMASMPLIWVLPLAVYLISFILIFDSRWRFDEGLWPAVWMALVGFFLLQCTLGIVSKGLANALGIHAPLAEFVERIRNPLVQSDAIRILGAMAGLMGACMIVHGHLGRMKPEGARATSYYLAIAAGGVVGGALVSLVAPLVFRKNLELPLGMALTGGLLVWTARAASRGGGRSLARIGASALIFAGGLLWVSFSLMDGDSAFARDFYGMLQVEKPHPSLLALVNGRTCHGLQFVKDPLRPTAYYGEDSGAARAIRALQARKPALRIGVVGLGIGTLAALTRPEDEITFIEISPRDIELAGLQGSHFSVLRKAAGKVRVIEGEGRIALEHWQGPPFDLLVIDAFAGGHIPAHLLTEEALALDMRHVAPGGLLALHVSHHLPLAEQVGATLKALDFWGVLTTSERVTGQDRFGNQIAVEFPASYWLLGRSEESAFLAPFFQGAKGVCAPAGAQVHPALEPLRAAWLKGAEGLSPWTDERHSLAPLVFRRR